MEIVVGLIGVCYLFNNFFVFFGCGDLSNKFNKVNFFIFVWSYNYLSDLKLFINKINVFVVVLGVIFFLFVCKYEDLSLFYYIGFL